MQAYSVCGQTLGVLQRFDDRLKLHPIVRSRRLRPALLERRVVNNEGPGPRARISMTTTVCVNINWVHVANVAENPGRSKVDRVRVLAYDTA